MAKYRNQSPPPPQPEQRFKTGQLILFVLSASLAALIAIKYLPRGGGDTTRIPKEMTLNYLPADFRFDVNEETALAVLTNPKRYRREFNQLVYDLNMAILNHVGTRMGLTNDKLAQLPALYEKQHPYLRNLYFEDFLTIQDTTSALYQTWYDNGFKNATQVLYDVASKYTCFLVNAVIGELIPMQDDIFYAKGKKVDTPCGIAMSEALAPFMKKLQDRAAIEDFGRARGLLQERVEKAVSELATYEVRDKKGLSKQLQTKVWGFSVSKTDIEISAISILKIGFRLDQYLKVDLNPRSKIVTVTLPQPVILSHEVYPKFDKLSIGWLREVKDEDLNAAFNILREEFRREAFANDSGAKAKAQAQDIVNTLFGPVISTLGSKYKLRVQFQEATPDAEFAPDDQFKDLGTPKSLPNR